MKVTFFLLLQTPLCFSMFGKKEEKPPNQFEFGMLDKFAEEAHFTGQRFGFVNFDRQTDETLFKMYNSAAKGHEITSLREYNEEVWMKLKNVKEKICRTALEDSVVVENDIKFDEEANPEEIALVNKTVVYIYHEKPPEKKKLVRCPVVVHGEPGFFVYATPFETIIEEGGNKDYYFILVDLFYEFLEDPPKHVIPLMGTRVHEKTWWEKLLYIWRGQ